MTDRIPLDHLTSDQLDELYADRDQWETTAYRHAKLWRTEQTRADEAEQHLRNIAQGGLRADAVQAEIGEMIAQTHELRDQLRRAEAAIERVRTLAARWENALAPDHAYARSLYAALDDPKDQP